jgi:pyridinium-3,5-bisthiocarboxylic acid mononucleotide nickel chelatase
MRLVYLDCFSGISGDMFLGALVDAGVPAKLLEETAAALGLGAKLEISRVMRAGIAATKVDVYAAGERDLPREAFWKLPAHSSGHSPAHGRGLAEIRKIVTEANISSAAKPTAIRIFEALASAEAQIHNCSVDKVHFHEVGAVDAMVDIVCAAVGADTLGVNEWVCSPLNVGGGTVNCAHGTLPIPAPATVKLLQNAPVYSSGPEVELVTPTGAAIVKTLARRFGAFPAMRIDKAGYGAGTRDFAQHPNVLRLTVGEAILAAESAISASASQSEQVAGPWSADRVSVLEANLDDLSPQVLAYAMEQLLAEGALDVFSAPMQMKKNRSGALLTVLSKPEDADRLTRLIFAETTTLGVRRRDEQRCVLERRWESVETQWGPVRIKIANMNGTVSNYAPEFEDCRRIAAERNVPLKTVMQEAVHVYSHTRRE